jgi:hypothetical protein
MKQWYHKIDISLQVTTGHSALIIIAYRQTLDRASFHHDYVALFGVHIKDKRFKQLRSKVWLVSWPLTALILLRLLIDWRARARARLFGRSWIAETFFSFTLAVIRVIKDNGYRKLAKNLSSSWGFSLSVLSCKKLGLSDQLNERHRMKNYWA